jgi:hypothetical protein
VTSTAEPGEIRLTARPSARSASRRARIACKSLRRRRSGHQPPVELLLMDWRDRSVFPRLPDRGDRRGARPARPGHHQLRAPGGAQRPGRQRHRAVAAGQDAGKQISRWHFELRRRADGLVLRSVSDSVTEVDGAGCAQGREAMVKPGTTVKVARVMTLTFQGADDDAHGGRDADDAV